MKSVRLLLVLLMFFSFSTFADHDEKLGQLKGENLGLYYTDHAISGHVKGELIFATPFEKEFGIKLTNRVNGKDFQSEFKKVGDIFTGKITRANLEGMTSTTEVKITKVNAKDGIIEGFLGETAFKVHVTAKSMEGNHYVNPEFHVTLPNSHYQFQLEDGMACMGCATKIVYVVLGMLRSTQVL